MVLLPVFLLGSMAEIQADMTERSDFTGTWQLTSESLQGKRSFRLIIDKDLNGLYQTNGVEIQATELKIDGGQLSFGLDFSINDQELAWQFKGTLDGEILSGQWTTEKGNRNVTGRKVAVLSRVDRPKDRIGKVLTQPEMPPTKAVPMRPHLLVTAEKIDGLRSLAELRTAIKSGHSKKLWETMLALADADVSSDPIPGGPRDWADVHAAGIRLLRLSLTSLVLGEPAGHPYRDAALEQLDCLFDPDCGWPNWHSGWHLDVGINEKEFWLRHGMFCQDIGFAYDWLYSSLTPAQRQTIIDGLNVYVFPQYHFSATGGGYGGAFNRRDNIKANNLGGAAI